ncbi:mucin-binding protein [Secundilactobacillus muriivasis]
MYDFDIQADPDAVAGTGTLKMYYTVKDQVQDISNGVDTDGAMTGDPTAVFVPIQNATYTIKNMSGIYGITMVQGSNDTGYSRAGTTSIYQPLADNQFAVNVQNLTANGLTNVSELINLPTIGDMLKSQYDVQLTKGATNVPTGVTVSYSTLAQDQQSGTLTTPDSTGYVSADDVTDWSAIKSILIQTDNLAANTNLGRVVFNVQDPNQLADLGKTAYFDSGTYADGLTPIVLKQASAASMTISGKATVKYAYQLPDGTTIPASALTQTLNINQDTLKVPIIKNTDLPTGYRLINPTTGLAITSTNSTAAYKVGNIVNSDADYSSLGGQNGTAVIGQVATYDFDGDTILIPVVDTATQTVTVNYIDDITQTTLASKVLTGASLTPVLDGTTAYVTTPTINNYVKAGYKLVSDATNGISLTFDDDLTQSPVYDVHLTHTTTIVTPTTPGTPGNLIPNTTTQWPAGVTATDLKKDVTRTINYVYGDGQSQVSAPVVQTATFTRDAIVDNATGTVLGYLPDSSLAAYKADPTSVALSKTDGWSATQTFAKVDSPTADVKTGYIPDQTTVAALNVAATDTNSEVKVIYAQIPKSVAIAYYDESDANRVLEKVNLDGYVGKVENYDTTYQATLAKYEALGYVFDKMTGNTLSDSGHVITYTGTDTPQLTAVYLKHAAIAVTPDQPAAPGSDMPNTTTKWPTETGDLSRTITQVVNYVYDDGTQVAPSVTRSVTYQRAAIVDAVSGDFIGYLPVAVADNYVSYENNDSETQTTAVKPTDTPSTDDGWKISSGDANFAALTSPVATKAGYTADLATTTAYTALPSTGSAKLTITYKPDQQLATVSYIDDDANGAEVHVDTINGVTAGTNNYSRVRTAVESGLTKLGYTIVGTTLPAGNVITFDDDATTPQTYLVHLKHQTVTVTPDQPKTPGTTMPSTDLKWPKGAQALDLNRTVTQTTNYVYASGGKAADDMTQTVTFQRAAIVDRITGQLLGYLAPDQLVAYQTDPTSVALTSDAGWQATGETTFNSQSSPKITGYTPDLANTADYSVTPTTGDLKLTVTYNPDQQIAIVTYVDDDANGAQVHQDTINSVSNGTHDYSPIRTAIQGGLTRLGYTIVGTDLPTDNIIAFDTDDATPQQFTVHLKHQTQTITPDQPGRPGEPIITNNPDGPKWPAGSDKTGLEQVVTETVNYVYDKDGQPAAPTVTDTVTFTRTGTVDLTNGQMTYTDWVAKDGKTSFTAKLSPVITSYLASEATVPAVTGLTPTSSDVTKTVTYKALGGYTTNLPNVPTITYPNDPTDAGKTITTVIPNVPGYQPVGPDGQPLQPVDPGDLTKGYLPPVVTDPYVDTPITYQPTVTPGGTDGESTNTPVITTTETPATAVTPETPASAQTTNVPTQPATPINASATPVQSVAKTPTNATPLQSATEQATATGEIATETGLQTTKALAQANQKGATAKSITTKLPQTNERPATGLSLLGLSLLGLLVLGRTRRRKDD